MKIYYFNSTHWDREWYYAKEAFRTHLVAMTRVLLKHFREDNLEKFTFDGQTIVLEDILEIHPEWRGELEALIRDGRLNVGPWYVMPDELLVSGEALIRNLLRGGRIARSFGHAPWSVGYVCDIFGHIGQLPQIMKGFGMDGIVLWRGVPDETPPRFLWQSPDGTVMPTVHFSPRTGYSEFTLRVRGTKDVELDEAGFKERFMEWLPQGTAHWGDKVLVCTDAQDHAWPARDLDRMLQWIRECCPGADLIHSDFRDFFRNEFSAGEETALLQGEQIHPAEMLGSGGLQISGTLSSRYDIKSANDRSQSMLELGLEPIAAADAANGFDEGVPFLNYAWKHLLQNHAHDSICGCSPDMVHRHMLPRCEEVQTVAEEQFREFIYRDLEKISGGERWQIMHSVALDEEQKRDAMADPDGNYVLRTYNTLPYPVNRVMEAEIRFPSCAAYPQRHAEPFSTEQLNNFSIIDEKGCPVDYSITSVSRKQVRVMTPGTSYFFDIYKVLFRSELRASGWTSFQVMPKQKPMRNYDSLLTGRRSASNGIISLEIGKDGTYTVTDLRSGRSYPGQNDYRMDREIGDGWGHVHPRCASWTVGGYCAAVRIVRNTPARAEFQIVRRFEMPEEVICTGGVNENYEGLRESGRNAVLEIHTFVALDRDSDALAVRTEFTNNVSDYRLQLLLPTGIAGDYFASQAFSMVTRKPGRALGKKTEGFVEAEPPDKNFSGILGKRDAQGGLAFISRGGLHECGCLTAPEGDLTVTLLRAFRRTVEKNGEETEGQLRKHLVYQYALKCITPETAMRHLVQEQQIMQSCAMISATWPAALVKNTGDDSFLRLEGDLTFSALKPAEDGTPGAVVLRVVNLSDSEAQGTITTGRPFRKACLCTLAEGDEQTLASDDTRLVVSCAPWQIRTIKFVFRE
ncbi:MAG: hypothetical protein J6S21_07800 [Victivallales bacterium]|nr:hypothetical protein [Victivallales bacterium]